MIAQRCKYDMRGKLKTDQQALEKTTISVKYIRRVLAGFCKFNDICSAESVDNAVN